MMFPHYAEEQHVEPPVALNFMFPRNFLHGAAILERRPEPQVEGVHIQPEVSGNLLCRQAGPQRSAVQQGRQDGDVQGVEFPAAAGDLFPQRRNRTEHRVGKDAQLQGMPGKEPEPCVKIVPEPLLHRPCKVLGRLP